MEQISNLPLGQKIEALLAGALGPLFRRQIIEWLDITPEEANSPDFEAFLAPFCVVAGTPEEEQFWIPKDRQAEAIMRIGVDIHSVRQCIINAAKRKIRKR